MAHKSILCAVVAFALLAAAHAQSCSVSPSFKGAPVTLSFCHALKALKPGFPASATVAWNATATSATFVVTCTKLPKNGYCAFGLSPGGKMAGSDMVVGYVNPFNKAQSNVQVYTAASHTNVKPAGSSGKLIQLTSKAVQVVSPTAMTLKFTATPKSASAFKSLQQIWAFGPGVVTFGSGRLRAHAVKAYGVGQLNLLSS